MPGLLFCVSYLLLNSLQSRFFFFLKGIFPARIFQRTWINLILDIFLEKK